MTLSHRIEAAASWLINSGIQEPDGGVHRWYREDTHFYAGTTTELTAYTISALRYLLKRKTKMEYATAIRHGACWIESCWNQGAQLMPYEPGASLSYFFDTGIVTKALRECGSPLARDCELSMSSFVADKSCWPILTIDGEPYERKPSRWSTESGCYQLKPAIWAGPQGMPIEAGEGFLRASDPPCDTVDRLHPFCYWMEGLLGTSEAGSIGPDIEKAGIAVVHHTHHLLRSDVLAQILRLRLYCSAAGTVPLDGFRAKQEFESLLSFQVFGDDQRTDGGFYFGKRGNTMLPYVNPCSTAFALQAMQMWMEHQNGILIPDWREIV